MKNNFCSSFRKGLFESKRCYSNSFADNQKDNWDKYSPGFFFYPNIKHL